MSLKYVCKQYRERVKEHGRRYVWKYIIRYKFIRPADRVFSKFFIRIFSYINLRDTIILESHNDFDSNGGAFYNFLVKNNFNNKYKIIWLIRNKKPKQLPKNVYAYNVFRPNIHKFFHLATAKYIVTCQDIIGSFREGQLSYYLTHGAVSIKSVKGMIQIPDNLNYFLNPSDFVRKIYIDDFNVTNPVDRMIIVGYPCHDVLYNNKNGDLYKITSKKYCKVILWMPTFRKANGFWRNDSIIDLPMGIPIINNCDEYNQINSFLKKLNVLLIIKIHPMQDLGKIRISSLSNILVLDGDKVKELDVDNYSLMIDADALISDYSSVVFDFLHLNRPIGYTLDDRENYKLDYLIKDIDEIMAGEKLYNVDDLYNFINHVVSNEDPYFVKRIEVLNKMFMYHDGNSSKRLAQHMGITNS